MENKDGYYRLQVERYESLELNNFKGSLVSIDSEMNFRLEENTKENVSIFVEVLVVLFRHDRSHFLLHRIPRENSR